MKTITYITLLVCLLSFSSCNDWLNVTPQGNVEAEDLYKTNKGCNSALAGIYYTLTSIHLYGQDLSYGKMDVMARYWNNVSTDQRHGYYEYAMHNYSNASVQSWINSVWNDMYQAVTLCNAFIQYSEPNKATIDNYNLMLGEVYGLRAFIHMRLFEMFGPVIHTPADLQKSAIPYRTRFDVTSQPFDTGATVLAKAEQDLQTALGLLAEDPIRNPAIGREGDANSADLLNYQDVLNFRGSRINYFCALGLLSQLELLRQDKDKAYQYATRAIEEAEKEDIITLIDKTTIEGTGSGDTKQLNYSPEMLGALYVENLFELTDQMFVMGNEGGSSSANILFIDNTQFSYFVNNVYGRQPDGAGNDNRLNYWFADGENSNKIFTKLKEYKIPTGMQGVHHYPVISIMRMSELYYIACECQIGKDNTLALQYLNDVRNTRNLEDIPNNTGNPITDDVLLEYLVREARKDLLGDGRMFLMYKRLQYPMYVSQGVEITPSDKIFVFPIPDDEYEYSGNEKPSAN